MNPPEHYHFQSHSGSSASESTAFIEREGQTRTSEGLQFGFHEIMALRLYSPFIGQS